MRGSKACSLVVTACVGSSLFVCPAGAQNAPSATQPVPLSSDAAKSSNSAAPATPAAPAVQTEGQALPPVVVTEQSTKRRLKKRKRTASKKIAGRASVAPSASPVPPAPTVQANAGQQATSQNPLTLQNDAFNTARKGLLTQIGTNSYSFDKDAIEALPQGIQKLPSISCFCRPQA